MAKNWTFIRDDVFPSWWANSIQEFIGAASHNLEVRELNDTTVEVPAGTFDDQVSIAIDGRWRFRTTSVTRAHPAGVAGTYEVYAVCKENSIVSTPLPFTDATDYNFDLRIEPPGGVPTIVPGTVDFYRKIGQTEWDGAKITGVRQLAGQVSTRPIQPQARKADETPVRVRGFAGQTADLVRVEDSAGLRRVGVTAAGLLTLRRAIATDFVADAAVDGDAQARFAERADGRLEWGDGAAVRDVFLYRSAANVLRTDHQFVSAGALSALGPATVGTTLSLNNAVIANPTETNPQIGSTGTGGGAYPFLEAGNLVIGSRWSGAARDILFYTGAPPTLRVAVDRAKDGLLFGPVGAQDVDLYRDSANVLKTDDQLSIGAAGLGLASTGFIDVTRAAATVFRAFAAAGDAQPRFEINHVAAGGRLEFGPGGATAADTNLYRASADLLKTDDNFRVAGTAAGAESIRSDQGIIVANQAAGFNVAYATNVAAGAVPYPFAVNADGKLEWGAGAVARDTTLFRAAADQLKTDDRFLSGTGVLVDGATGALGAFVSVRTAAAEVLANTLLLADANRAFRILGDGKHEWGAGGATALDTNLYRRSANELATDDAFAVQRQAALDTAWAVHVAGDGQRRFYSRADGRLLWGDGTALQDVNLYREAADVLATDDKLHVVGELELDGALNHDGATVGFYAATPVAQEAGWGNPTGGGLTGGVLRAALTDASTLQDTKRYLATLAKRILDTGLVAA